MRLFGFYDLLKNQYFLSMITKTPTLSIHSESLLHHKSYVYMGYKKNQGILTIRDKQKDYVYITRYELTEREEELIDNYLGYPHIYDKTIIKIQDSCRNAYDQMIVYSLKPVAKINGRNYKLKYTLPSLNDIGKVRMEHKILHTSDKFLRIMEETRLLERIRQNGKEIPQL